MPVELHRATLPNGLRVLIVPDPVTPVVGVAVHVDVGFRSEPEGRTGFAHLFEHLMFQGSESLEKLAHFRHVQSSGGVFNGSTHQDYTDYFEVLPAAALERALFLEADRLRAPKLTAENLRNQVDVVKEEIRLNVLNRPYGGFPWILLPPVLYDTFPNAHNGYGDFSELEQASLDDAAAFFDTFYAPGNAQLTVAGYLDVDETLRLVEKHFGDIPARATPPRPSFAEPPPGRRTAAGGARRARPAARAGRSATGCPTRAPTSTATSATRCSARCSATARRPGCSGGWCTPTGSSPTSRPGAGLMGPLDARDPDTFTITAVHPAAVDPDRVLAAVDEELDKLAADGPTPDELDRQVARWSAALHQENDRVMYRMLGLGARELLYGRAEIAMELPGPAGRGQPGAGRAAAAALRSAGRAVLLVEPAAGHGGAGMTAVAHRTAEQIGRTEAGPRPLPAARPDPRRPAARRRRAARCPTGCGCSPPAGPRCRWWSCGCGCPFAGDDPSHPAVAELLSSTLLTGTTARDRVEIDDELAAVGADLGVSVDPERLSISGSGLASGLRRDARRAGRRAHRGHPPRPRGGPGARAAGRADHHGPRPAAHDRPGGVAAQAVRRPPDHPGDAHGGGGRGGHRGAGAGAAGGRAGAARVDPDPGRRPRPGRGDRAGGGAAGRLDVRSTRPASCRRRRRSPRATWSWCTGPARCSPSCG